MEQLIEFAGNHPILVAAFLAILTLILYVETRRLQMGGAVDPNEATQLYNRERAVFIDTRAEEDYRKAHLPGAVHVPGGTIAEQQTAKLKRYKDRPLIVYCESGVRSGRIVATLRKQGFEQALSLRGGIQAWLGAGFPVEGK